MTLPSETASSRNAPCPCGSGKKHKQCCGRTSTDTVAPVAPVRDVNRSNRRWSAFLGLLLLVALVLAALNLFGPERAAPVSPEPQMLTPAIADGMPDTPPAWFHDTVNNRHWDPNHQHWHEGPPPPGAY